VIAVFYERFIGKEPQRDLDIIRGMAALIEMIPSSTASPVASMTALQFK
jgi:hypothetical protein